MNVFATLAVLFVVAAPAPDPNREARQKLGALKARLPTAIAAWGTEHWYKSSRVELRSVKLQGPDTAKVVVVSFSVDSNGIRDPNNDEGITVYLRFFDGSWSATRFKATWPANNDFNNKGAWFLMLAIDEAAEK